MFYEGVIDPGFIIRESIASEDAFDVMYPKHIIRVGHNKGDWRLCKIRDGKAIDYLVFKDCGDGAIGENEMTIALFNTILSETPETERGLTGGGRYRDSVVVEKAFRIWAGKPTDIIGIHVYQSGRNSWVESDGSWNGSFKS